MAPSKIKRVLAGSLVLAAMMSIGGCTTLSEHKSTSEYVQSGKVTGSGYETTEVYEGDFVMTYQTDAYVTYTMSQYLYWENSQDRYDEIFVSAGDMVKKGDVLATFEVSSISEADILERELAVQEAQSTLNKAIKSYEDSISQKEKSLETLTDYDYQIASLELEKLKSEYAQRRAEGEYQIANLQEALDELLERKNKTELVAPFDGRIDNVNREFKKGNKVNAGYPIVQISDLNSQVLAFRNTNFTGDVSYLSEVTLTDRVTQEKYTGRIVSCSNVTGGTNDSVIIELDEELPEGREDVYFKVDGYLMQKEKVTLVDNRAVKSQGNDYYVFVLTENNATYKAYVTVGGTSEGATWIVEGLTPGQTVVID